MRQFLPMCISCTSIALKGWLQYLYPYLYCWLPKPYSSHPIVTFSQISRLSSLSFGCHDVLCLGLPFHFCLGSVQIVVLKFFFRKYTGKVKGSNYLHVWKYLLNLKGNLDWYVIPALKEFVLRTLKHFPLSSINFSSGRVTQSSSHFSTGNLFLLQASS